ncbi:hypothetical protein PYJP_13840 [Pyrofollis japonicus]|uniref:hypothetical protein n=1 Tax=Pyrofollis japonicus TaxID=3060460 RepID=UPI00295B20A2|nr:hypothetical protein [Pyrofollis japonicus]BEP18032.1 hypothetical protein PYJP_13840 [Pyrofollis japonicus]
MKRVKGLLIPVLEALRESCCSRGILSFPDYYEFEAYSSCNSRYNVERRIRPKTFAHIEPTRIDTITYELVFLNPYEALSKLDGELVTQVSPPVPGKRPRMVSVKRFRDFWAFKRFLEQHWCASRIIAVSNHIAIATIEITQTRIKQPTRLPYAYGYVDRILDKISVYKLLHKSKPIIKFDKMPSDISNGERARILAQRLQAFPLPWPWSVVGLVIDKSRGLITALNPRATEAILVKDLLELRVLDLHAPRVSIPILVVRKLTLINPLFPVSGNAALSHALLLASMAIDPLMGFNHDRI